MKKYIIKRIKEKIELNGQDYAEAYIALSANHGQTNPEGKKNIAACELAMKKALERIEFLKKMLKDEEQ